MAALPKGKYRQALDWIALNDDTEFLDEEDGMISVTLSLAADLRGRDSAQAIADLKSVRAHLLPATYPNG